MQPLRFGIVGLGTMGKIHLDRLRSSGMEVVGAVRGADHGLPVYPTLDGLLAKEAPDCLVIASPNALHREHVLRGLEAGCHILCDKPLGIRREDVGEMQQAAERHERVLMTGMNLRFLAHTRSAREHIRDNATGDLRRVTARWVQKRGIPGPGKWHTNRRLAGGGVLLDLGVHVLDTAWWILGRPRPVTVSASPRHLFTNRLADYRADKIWNGPVAADGIMDVEDGITAEFRFGNGCPLSLELAWASEKQPSGFELAFIGEKAELHWHKNGSLFLRDGNGDRTMETTSSARNIYEAFARATRGAPNPVPPRDMMVIASMVDAAYASCSTKRELAVPDAG